MIDDDWQALALKAKQDRLAEFKIKKKNLVAKKKFEGLSLTHVLIHSFLSPFISISHSLSDEVYTIKSKVEEKMWEQVEVRDTSCFFFFLTFSPTRPKSDVRST